MSLGVKEYAADFELKTSLTSMFSEPKVRKQARIQCGAATVGQYRGYWWVASMKQ